jgi:hypothetical protein
MAVAVLVMVVSVATAFGVLGFVTVKHVAGRSPWIRRLVREPGRTFLRR